MMESFDFIIVGSGAGGGTLARALSGNGASILVIERGDYLPAEPENRSPKSVFVDKRYKTNEVWQDAQGRPYAPGMHYFVGGNTKVYGAALPRLRREDFRALEHEGGTSPAWPITYEELEPYYCKAEEWYWVHGKQFADPTDPPRSKPYPFPPMPAGEYMNALAEQFRLQGLQPYPLPIGVDYRPKGRCIRCRTCDAFPCPLHAKADAEVCGLVPALTDPDVKLWTNTRVTRVVTDPSGKTATGVEFERGGSKGRVGGGTIVIAAGAVNSSALLLRSNNSANPRGLANGSDQVGRNYMVHNNAVLAAVDTSRPNPTVFQKTWALNDFYFSGPGFPWPMGNLQPIGKMQGPMFASALPKVPARMLDLFASSSVEYWVMSEDLPDPENRVTVDANGKIKVFWKPNNLVAHRKLGELASQIFREAGYRIRFERTMGIETNSHQVGTIRFGADPATSVLDSYCRTWQIPNLLVMDASFFPSSAAVNPALTIIAQALRVADTLLAKPMHTG